MKETDLTRAAIKALWFSMHDKPLSDVAVQRLIDEEECGMYVVNEQSFWFDGELWVVAEGSHYAGAETTFLHNGVTYSILLYS